MLKTNEIPDILFFIAHFKHKASESALQGKLLKNVNTQQNQKQ